MKTNLKDSQKKTMNRLVGRQGDQKDTNRKTNGPSHFELEYFRQLREEIDIFLHSKGFTTIKEVHIDLYGSDFRGHLQVNA